MIRREHDERAFEEMVEAEMAREEETKRKLAELIVQRRAEKSEASTRTRGHATRVLRTKTDELRAMLPHFTLGEMVDLLAEADVHVNYHSLRNFLRKHLPEEYLEYVAIGQGKGGFAPIPEHLADAPPSPGEFDQNQTPSVSAPAANKEKAKEPVATKKSETNSDIKQEAGNFLLDAANPRKLGLKNRNNS